MRQPRAVSRLSDVASDARDPVYLGSVPRDRHQAGADSATASSLVMPWGLFAWIAQNGLSVPTKLYPA
jgi:hypothetical protein